MNIKDFLLDNYIYIIVVIVLIIITIIGFLADKKKNETKKAEGAPQPNPGVAPVNNTPITYNPGVTMMPNSGNMNTPVMPVNNQMVNNMNQNVGSVEPMPMPGPINVNPVPQPQMNNVVSPQPVEPMNSGMAYPSEPMYQPLAEQQPHFENVAPVMPTPGPMNVNPQMVNNMAPMPTMEPMNNMNMAPNPVPEPQPVAMPNVVMPNNVNMGVPNNGMGFNQNPMPIPNPVENTVPNPITPPQPVNPSPVGFVYGPGQNNNQNMQ